MAEQEQIIVKKRVDLRIQFIHRPTKNRLFNKKFPFLIQNEPFEYGIKVKNIGQEYFSGALISDFSITVPSANMHQKASKQLKIKPLNPGEECELYLDKYTLWHEGSLSLSCHLSPENDAEDIQTYQHHKDHDFDEPYSKLNEWWQDYYCQGQQQLLQTRTNNLILILTIITVVEAIFGLKQVLKFFSYLFASAFGFLSAIFSMWAS